MAETLGEIEARMETAWSELRSAEVAGQSLAVCALLYDRYLRTLDEWTTTRRLQQHEAAAEARREGKCHGFPPMAKATLRCAARKTTRARRPTSPPDLEDAYDASEDEGPEDSIDWPPEMEEGDGMDEEGWADAFERAGHFEIAAETRWKVVADGLAAQRERLARVQAALELLDALPTRTGRTSGGKNRQVPHS